MHSIASLLVGLLVKAGIVLLAANEVRGFVMAAPVLYTLYETGGTIAAIWIAFCSLAGIALSVFGPLYIARKLKLI